MTFLSRVFNKSPKEASNSSISSSTESKAPSTAPSTEPPTSSPPASTTPNPDAQLTNADKFTFLQELTGNQKHRYKTFYDHLFNVYSHLKSQGCPEELCDAGLFHSIYGTEFYRFQNNRITRDIVRGIIGEYAEELVYIFCTSRPRFRVIVENRLGLTSQMVLDLCHVEFANLWDQNEKGQCDAQLKILRETIGKLEKGEQIPGKTVVTAT